MTVLVGIPLGAVAAMPGLALDPNAHGPLAYVVALVLTATGSLARDRRIRVQLPTATVPLWRVVGTEHPTAALGPIRESHLHS